MVSCSLQSLRLAWDGTHLVKGNVASVTVSKEEVHRFSSMHLVPSTIHAYWYGQTAPIPPVRNMVAFADDADLCWGGPVY